MFGLDNLEIIYVISAILFQIVLIIHFSLRKWYFDFALAYGWIVYALGIPYAAMSFLILLSGKAWTLWTGGFLYFVWGGYGYTVEYIKEIQWRNPIRWPVLSLYLLLYLATVMFYWWPLAIISKPLWYVYAVLFCISTVLNVFSHKKPQDLSQTV
jgi:hypothetical protein